MNAHETLSLWESFYVIVGSSAGALTGLQFVVMAIVADQEDRAGQGEVDAFGTPNVVHFCAVLLVSAIISAPWPKLQWAAAPVLLTGVLGTLYTLIVIRRTTRTTKYRPVLEDWIFHAVLPLTAYVVLALSAAFLTRYELTSLFGIATFSLILLFVGIHNAWDTVTYIAVGMSTPAKGSEAQSVNEASRRG